MNMCALRWQNIHANSVIPIDFIGSLSSQQTHIVLCEISARKACLWFQANAVGRILEGV